MGEVRHPQLQCVTCLQSAGLSYPNHGISKDLAIYIKHFLCVKWLTHIPQGQYDWNVQNILKENMTEKTSKELVQEVN